MSQDICDTEHYSNARRLAVDADLYCKERNIDDLIEDAKEFLKKDQDEEIWRMK